MISELVAGSAWIWPPVEGCALAVTGLLAGLLPPVGVMVREGLPAPVETVEMVVSPASAARKVLARATASAFFR
jgi:hypothetical protein